MQICAKNVINLLICKMAKLGRKTKYNSDRVARICKIISEGGTEKSAFEAVGVSESQYYEWKATKSEFAEAVKKAKAEYENWLDVQYKKEAGKSLMLLIKGTEYTETTSEYGLDKQEKPIQTKRKDVTKKVLPNITAVIFALTNRDPEKWKNRLSSEVRGELKTESKSDISLANVPDELLEKVIDAIQGE